MAKAGSRLAPLGAMALLAVLVLTAALPAYAQTETVLHSFNADGTDGYNPYSGLTLDAAGNLYGTTLYSSSLSAPGGTVFKVAPDGTETVLYNFAGAPDGSEPYYSGVVRDAAGNLYGTTIRGGTNDLGIVYKLAPDGTETVLYSFSPIHDGYYPYGGVVLGKKGTLYGTTSTGGTSGVGTVYKITRSHKTETETVLYNFAGQDDGCYPRQEDLIVAKDGSLYGTTVYCGPFGDYGTVFKVDPAGIKTVLHNFNADGVDGFNPYGGLVVDKAGNLYGTTYGGGKYGYGTVFKLSPSGNETVLYSFNADGTDGINPYGAVALGKKGNIYGTTYQGGTLGYGTVFKLSASGTETVLHSFANTDGAHPYAGVALDKSGALFGTTVNGGDFGYGVVFKIVP
ncbi:MAG TPA: choice-of-anchor tandem repeat GloVer-containing protein [Terriglobales bacterium]|nr:choice-of-anchor tandem repeat GloVer-containing protein [Terriglobales bacterium]